MNKMVIMRGVPGSGKSTYIANNFPGAVVCSADHYFAMSGKYVFDPSKLGVAHGECFKKAAECVQLLCAYNERNANRQSESVIVIDNTNIRATEIAPYVLLGEAYRFDVEIILLNVEPARAAARNVHGVSATAVMSMYTTMWAQELPPYWKQRIIETPLCDRNL